MKFDPNYFDKMSFIELKTYLKKFSSYEDFLKREKIPFVPRATFDNWLYTVHFMDIDINKMQQSSYNFFKSSITIEKIKYEYGIVKVLMNNYQSYKEAEYSRIINEFKQLAIRFNG
jgi:hypothetical protein